MDKAQWASHMANDEFFKEMMLELRNAEIDSFSQSGLKDISLREHCYLKIKVLDEIDAHIKGMAAQKVIDRRWKIL